MALGLRFEQDVPLGKIGAFLGQWYGISITSSGLSQMFDRLRRRSAPSYDELVRLARASTIVGLDETGHRQDGVPGWMWLMRTDRVSVFRVESRRPRRIASLTAFRIECRSDVLIESPHRWMHAGAQPAWSVSERSERVCFCVCARPVDVDRDTRSPYFFLGALVFLGVSANTPRAVLTAERPWLA